MQLVFLYYHVFYNNVQLLGGFYNAIYHHLIVGIGKVVGIQHTGQPQYGGYLPAYIVRVGIGNVALIGGRGLRGGLLFLRLRRCRLLGGGERRLLAGKIGHDGEQVGDVLRQAEAGMPIKELCRNGGFSDATFYKWRAKFGGMQVSEAQRLRELESENAKLKRLLAEAHLDMHALKSVLGVKR